MIIGASVSLIVHTYSIYDNDSDIFSLLDCFALYTQIVFPSDTDQDKCVPTGACDETDRTIVKTVMFSCSHSA